MIQMGWHMIGSTNVSTSPTTLIGMSSQLDWTGRTAQSLLTQTAPEASLLTLVTGKSFKMLHYYKVNYVYL